ncbi:hypothetical protein Ahy_B06g085494 isoform F [Arachis hypogaea]|uniref:Uncharacterized protein n=1 Tax=Arachis hypogaea TaxID=3818 RepID=A0A444YUT4_ARAHY|nr:hypothetical protein Ahy_B06g085494 isoform F [Arachis hypogaea]
MSSEELPLVALLEDTKHPCGPDEECKGGDKDGSSSVMGFFLLTALTLDVLASGGAVDGRREIVLVCTMISGTGEECEKNESIYKCGCVLDLLEEDFFEHDRHQCLF